MNNSENKTNTTEQVLKLPDIEFDEKKGILLVNVDKDSVDIQKVREVAKKMGLIEKDEIHVTVIGNDTAETILASLEKLPEDERIKTLSQIQEFARRTNWKFNFKSEFYYIKKAYNDPDQNNPNQIIPEIRESIIQIVDTENLKEFYDQLREITGLQLEAPLPHVTLFTISTREDKKKRGIGIYSEKDFGLLNPEKIKVD